MSDKRLTAQQEMFINCIMQGKTQKEAYLTAYPTSQTWTDNAVRVAAHTLLETDTIKEKLQELGYQSFERTVWTRDKALETINYVMELNKKEMERLNQAYQDEIDLLEAKLMEFSDLAKDAKTPDQMYKIGKQMQEITAQIAKAKKQRRTNSTNIRGIYDGAKLLNRMYGLDITKVQIENRDEEREELNKLSADELKAVIAAAQKENS